ncbi:hypothetical protein HMPREF9136_2610 [Prevotella dentalis DSM 3688]|uniref:DUF2958 domain-containing protein n=2 Tax=Prevotella dentalis (strain ATCC 49559 / DSM 3688 / JCM 13448 / NCTC 12043 / ES 2772) TaxID=908937 RepID=F9D6Y2_PREDD|nr:MULTISPECIES: hypothetical protein [Prevotella]EGQ11851.1 hypothetical protein HMPREF9136_2610 [Prevotella dentalis DSM 3688]QUB71721.1 hypothetical protein J4864_11375 [Prevotella multiformis]
MANRLMTAELAEQLKNFPLYSQDGRQKDATCVCVFEIGLIRWYVLEGQPEGDDFTLFCIVVGMAETEYGYASVKEMEGITVDGSRYGLGMLSIKQMPDFRPCPLAEIQDRRLQDFLSRLYAEQ